MTRARGADRRAAGRAQARLRSCSLALLGALAGGCLVTQEATYAAPDSPPRMVRVLPEEHIVRVPLAPDPECGGAEEMPFEVRLAHRDTAEILFWQLRLNDSRLREGTVGPSADGSEERELRPVCIPYAMLNTAGRCNRVRMIVTSDIDRPFEVPVAGELDFKSATVEWTVVRGSSDPDVSVVDCITKSPSEGETTP